MKDNQHKITSTNIGSLSLVMVFSVLILTVFAILSFVTAKNDYELAKKFASSAENYYIADYKASEALEEIAKGKEPACEDISEYIINDNVFSFSVPIDEHQLLKVSAKVTESKFNILSWKAESISPQIFDESIPVWTGEEGVLP